MKIVVSYLVLVALMAAALGIIWFITKGNLWGLILFIIGLAVGIIILYRAAYKYFS